tara:strand:+ start:1307 stop:1453 length:147 start_codon:yes stop_codon:yes gene_type:complete
MSDEVVEIKRCCMECIHFLLSEPNNVIEYDHMVCDGCGERMDFVEVIE